MVSSGDVPTRGKLIVFEGAEGVGKSTQIQRLAAWLETRGLDVVQAREPGGTGVGEAIRGVFLHRKDLEIPPKTELLLMLAARAAFVREVVEPALRQGSWVLADRFDLSTFAYQGFGRGLSLDEIEPLNAFATGGLIPELYVVLDLPVAVGRERQLAQGAEGDRIESEGLAFLARVRQGYLALVDRVPTAEHVPAGGSVEEVEALIRSLVENRFPETLGPRRGSI